MQTNNQESSYIVIGLIIFDTTFNVAILKDYANSEQLKDFNKNLKEDEKAIAILTLNKKTKKVECKELPEFEILNTVEFKTKRE